MFVFLLGSVRFKTSMRRHITDVVPLGLVGGSFFGVECDLATVCAVRPKVPAQNDYDNLSDGFLHVRM